MSEEKLLKLRDELLAFQDYYNSKHQHFIKLDVKEIVKKIEEEIVS